MNGAMPLSSRRRNTVLHFRKKRRPASLPAFAFIPWRTLLPEVAPRSYFAYWFDVTRMLVQVLDFWMCGSLPFGGGPARMPVIDTSG